MTLIEFFGRDAIENVCSCLTRTPDRVIFIGDSMKLMQKHVERYRAVLAPRGIDPEFLCQTVSKNNMQTIVDALSRIVETCEDCVFDLTGGEELYLTAIGVVFQKYRDRNLQLHRFNIRNNTIIDVDQDGHTILEGEAPQLSIEENIRIYGGDIVYDADRKESTAAWDMNPEFRADIRAIWDVCRQDVKAWNRQMDVLAAAVRLDCGDDPLSIRIPMSALRETLENDGRELVLTRRIFIELYNAGILRACTYDEDLFTLTFKDAQTKACLVVAGQALEMIAYLSALEAREKDGETLYNDVLNGVFIDWDGEIGNGQDRYNTENEIDVMMMRGMVPVFVSCKNGYVQKEELYKFSTVAARFGGKYAKKVLIATALDDSNESNYLRQRAADMGIRVVEGYSRGGVFRRFTDLSEDELNALLRTFWSN